MEILHRYILAWMGCFGIMNVYFTRINISVAMVAMVGVTRTSNRSESACVDRFGEEESLSLEGEFDWSLRDQQLVMGSYYWGYTLAMIPAAWAATRVGFRLAFGLAMAGGAVTTLLFPMMARVSVHLALVARVILGSLHAVAFPAMTGAWGVWAPPQEKTGLNGIAVSGASLGTLVIFTLAGLVADSLGWEAVFYITGALNMVWVMAWFLLVADTPGQHRLISPEEREHIESSIGHQGEDHRDRRGLVTPWRAILTSVPVWGIVLGHTASNWGNYTLNQQLPTYLSNVLRYSLSFNGILSSVCYVIQTLVCLIMTRVTDAIISMNVMKTLTIRKLNTFIGLWVSGACAVLAVAAGCRAELAVILFALAAGLNVLTVPGCKTGALDIAPQHAGIVFGLSNTVANIPGFAGPAVVGALLTDYSATSQWYYVFCLGCLVNILGSLLYLLKGSTDLQDWAVIPKQEKGSTQVTNDGFVEIKL